MARTRSSGPKRGTASTPSEADTRRIDRLAEIVDQCTDAKRIADQLGDRFLAYLLAMAIQETRNAMRAEIKTSPLVGPADDG